MCDKLNVKPLKRNEKIKANKCDEKPKILFVEILIFFIEKKFHKNIKT